MSSNQQPASKGAGGKSCPCGPVITVYQGVGHQFKNAQEVSGMEQPPGTLS
jgi:hypothetical protein